LIPFGGVYPERSRRAQGRLLAFGPWESVKDEGAESREWREVNRSKLKAERERLKL